jgi:hypothetical protein
VIVAVSAVVSAMVFATVLYYGIVITKNQGNVQFSYRVFVNLSILLVAWNQIFTFWFMTGNDEIVQIYFE